MIVNDDGGFLWWIWWWWWWKIMIEDDYAFNDDGDNNDEKRDLIRIDSGERVQPFLLHQSDQTNLDHLICSIHTHTHILFTIYYQHQHKWNLHFLGIIDHDHRYHGGIFPPTLALSTFVSISGFDITKFNAFIALVNHNSASVFLANVSNNDAVIWLMVGCGSDIARAKWGKKTL